MSHRLFYLNEYDHQCLQFAQLYRNNVGTYHNIFVYACFFSFRITVIRYVKGTSAACTNALSIIIVIGKGKYRKRIYKEEKA
ncbi:hypothetical protein FYW06_14975 [Bacillus paranthracis]|uniref:Uncharacterized protein n=1 Tax=Bacillus paranthracis TaxID=2026186 RepID=A0A5M9GWZ4_9BACI|nr:hypothetical protein FYW06_14975 [Bacillus paranthracis]KAB7641379.1 hypothetical protein GBN96_04705 [Bacillus sp. B4-WWTP-NA-D-NA-NA]PCC79262.1 hypothetical protein CNQ76_12715 [Bacillus cereus]MBE7108023.1 hypothetical protein [Bacillus paranthracis]MBR9739690.1 hypothetical protein [Bacillus paranthracis]